jgi:hypothetical protein
MQNQDLIWSFIKILDKATSAIYKTPCLRNLFWFLPAYWSLLETLLKPIESRSLMANFQANNMLKT